jgi:hypothetical protein
VKFKGFTSVWDENHKTEGSESWKIQPVGAFSKAHGWAKDDPVFQASKKHNIPSKQMKP